MRIWSVFSVVIVFHLVILGLLLVQPGCQSSSAGNQPQPAATQVSPPPVEPLPDSSRALDPAFNAGVSSASQPSGFAASSRTMAPPTRPAGSGRLAPDTGGLEPVLEPVRDSIGLPAATVEYSVVPGDTLSGIARKQGVSLSALLEANGLNRSSVIYAGQKLHIPAAASVAAAVAMPSAPAVGDGRSIVVAKGDTLSGLAARHGTSVRSLRLVNNLSGDTIRVGQTLILPDESSPVPPSSSSSVSPATSGFSSVSAPSGGGTSYVVQPGDTPSGIARKFGLSSSQLMSANGISDPRKLRVGQSLVIPGASTARPVNPPSSSTASAAVPAPRPTAAATTTPAAVPAQQDPMSVLEALDDEDLPFVEVEVVDQAQQKTQPGN